MHVTVVPNRIRPETDALAQLVRDRLEAAGATVHTVMADTALPATAALTAALQGSDVAVAVGGDGTIMHVAKAAASAGCPVLGINGGHVGFLAGAEPAELDALTALLSGTYVTDERALLEITVHTAAGCRTALAMNEAVLSRGSVSRLVDVTVMVDGCELMKSRGGGIIVAPPTGSTASSLSAGGPVSDPAVGGVLGPPVCPHSLDSRSRVLPSGVTLTLRAVAADGDTAFITVDGEANIPLTAADTVTICRADISARLIRLADTTFYDGLRHKLFDRR